MLNWPNDFDSSIDQPNLIQESGLNLLTDTEPRTVPSPAKDIAFGAPMTASTQLDDIFPSREEESDENAHPHPQQPGPQIHSSNTVAV